MFLASLKSLIASLVSECPKEILLKLNTHINQVYANLKLPLLNHFLNGKSVKDQETFWKELTACFQDVLHPLLQATNPTTPLLQTDQENNLTGQSTLSPIKGLREGTLNHAIKAYQQKNFYWPKPLEMDFLQLEEPNDVASIMCQIGRFKYLMC